MSQGKPLARVQAEADSAKGEVDFANVRFSGRALQSGPAAFGQVRPFRFAPLLAVSVA